jgi:hypothetical protein
MASRGRDPVIAGDVRHVTLVEPLERLVVIDERWIRQAEVAAARVLDEFNEKGVGSVYSGEDVKLVSVFIRAVIAADRLRYTVESALSAGISSNVAHRGLPAAQRILANFNSRGGSAEFPAEDLDALMQLDKAVDAIEGPH